jgi:hypothetical protein
LATTDLRIELSVKSLRAAPPFDSPPATVWLTPRAVQVGWPAREALELLVVRPRWVDLGSRFDIDGAKVIVESERPHPLAAMPYRPDRGEVLDGFRMVVGETIDRVDLGTYSAAWREEVTCRWASSS